MTVHNHAPWHPMCAERRLPDGTLRGACLPDVTAETWRCDLHGVRIKGDCPRCDDELIAMADEAVVVDNVRHLSSRREDVASTPAAGPPVIEMFMDDDRIIFRDQAALDEYVIDRGGV